MISPTSSLGGDVDNKAETSAFEPRLAGIVFGLGFDIDRFLSDVITRLRQDPIRLAGVIQKIGSENTQSPRNLLLHGLRGGWELPILQDRGHGARGCRLDAGALAEAAARLDTAFSEPIDLLVINRFGRAESEGHGLRNIFERAAADGIPLLVGVREDYEDVWKAFHGGLGTELYPESAAVLRWWRAVGQA
jgi:hypothetical protein